MTREPHRWKPHWGHERVDPTRCRASVSNGRMGVSQCGNKVKEGVEFCNRHTPLKATDESPRLWVVQTSYFGNDPEMKSVAILKETKKQIVVEGHSLGAFGYKTRLSKKKDGNPEKGFRTKLEAAQAFVAKSEARIEKAKKEVVDAEQTKAKALEILAEVEKEES